MTTHPSLTPLRWWTPGIPRPQGSKRLARGRLIDANPHLRAWRRTLTTTARTMTGPDHQPLTGPVALAASFHLPRPTRTRHPLHPAGPPDLDKLVRAVCDALTAARIWHDDAQVVSIDTTKVWASAPGPGVMLAVAPMPRPWLQVLDTGTDPHTTDDDLWDDA